MNPENFTQEDEMALRDSLKRCSAETIEKAVSDIETALHNALIREVETVKIGEYALKKLRDIDQVAYVRFASVYRQFENVNMFMEELQQLLK